MNNKKNNLTIILLSVSCTLLLVAVILLATGNKFSFNTKVTKSDTNKENSKVIENEDKNEKQEKQEVIETSEPIKEETKKEETKQETKTEVKENSSNNNNNTVVEEKNTVNEKGTEEDVVNYFENQLTSFEKNPSDKTLGEKIKSGFVSIVDFIFYDKEIKGHTFKGLTNTAKIKIITLALKIDNKIDSYFPGYKDTISEKYRAVKEKLAEIYATYTVKLCETVGSDTCNQFKEDLQNMKTSFGITGDYLKEAFSKGSSKVKEMYENWRDK